MNNVYIEASVVELTADQVDELNQQRLIYLYKIAADLNKKKADAELWRHKYESDWADAELQYETGLTPLSDAKESSGVNRPLHIRANDNITRVKTLSIAARTQNILFPTNEKNWDLSVSSLHKSKLSTTTNNVGFGIEQLMSDAQNKVENLEREIVDVLSRTSYAKHGRDAIFNGCLYGAGIIHGPFLSGNVEGFVEHVVDDSVVRIPVRQKKVECLDTWEFFPQPSRDIYECNYVFVMKLVTEEDLKRFANDAFDSGFDPEQIKKAIEKGPSSDVSSITKRFGNDDAVAVLKDRFTLWKYYGKTSTKCLKYFGEEDDSINAESHMSEIWLCNGIVIRAVMRADFDKVSDIFHVWCFEKRNNSIFGRGVPNICAADQQTANTTWSAAVLNATMSSAPVIGVIKEMLETQDGKQIDLTFDKPKTLLLKETSDVRNALSAFVTPNTVGPSLDLYNQAKRNSDEHTMLPAFIQGAPTSAVTTSSGMAMMMNDSNIIQKRLSASWDDEVTTKLIKSIISLHLSVYSDNADFMSMLDIVPKGASYLLVKDIQLQHTITFLQMADNPNNSAYFNREELIKTMISHVDFPSEKVLNPREKVEQIQKQMQGSPSPEMMKLELDKYKAELVAEIDKMRFEFEIEKEIIRQRGALLVAQLNYDAVMAKAAIDERLSVQELVASMNMKDRDAEVKQFIASTEDARKRSEAAEKLGNQRFIAGMKTEIDAQKIADKAISREQQIANETPVRIAY